MASQPPALPRRLSKVKQACDACHTRKIRCDGEEPCANCLLTELNCTYLAVPKKKGPKGRRIAKTGVLGVKNKDKGPSLGGLVNPPLQIAIPAPKPHEQPTQRPSFLSSGLPAFQPSRLVTNELIRCCVDGFFVHKFPIMPILDRDQIYSMLSTMHQLPEQYGLVMALCSVMILQPEAFCDSPSSVYSDDSREREVKPSADFFIEETMRARLYCNHIEIPTLATVQTSFFLFASLFCTGKDNSAWFYIREAMTVLQLQRLHEETTYQDLGDTLYATFCRRTFWLLFITERAYALQRHRPLTLQRTIRLPTVSPGPEATILSGFLDLVSLFQNFDDTFLSLWNLSTTDSPTSAESLINLQDILKFAIPNVSERTEIQQADLLISRQWLKTMVWQLCVTKGLLSSSSPDESMSFQYPITIARDVVLVSRSLPAQAFEANGVGILEKVFDIGCSLSDVLLLHPGALAVSGMEIGPRDYLVELVRILGSYLGGNSKYLRLLATKADECLHVQLRGSLSESEASNTLMEDITEEAIADEEFEYEVHNNMLHHRDSAHDNLRYTGAGISNLEASAKSAHASRGDRTPTQFFDFPPLINSQEQMHTSRISNDVPFSFSAQTLNRILTPGAASFRGAFD